MYVVVAWEHHPGGRRPPHSNAEARAGEVRPPQPISYHVTIARRRLRSIYRRGPRKQDLPPHSGHAPGALSSSWRLGLPVAPSDAERTEAEVEDAVVAGEDVAVDVPMPRAHQYKT